MELFDKKFVYLEWDDVLKGKKVLAGDNLQFMRKDVNDGTGKFMCVEAYNNSSNSSELYPFKDDNGITWALVYYDPNYECKRAYAEGKTIQCRNKGEDKWIVTSNPSWLDRCEYSVKPEMQPTDEHVCITCIHRCPLSEPNEPCKSCWHVDGRPMWKLDKTVKVCGTCKYKDLPYSCSPCNECMENSVNAGEERSMWEPREVKKRRMTNRELAKWLAQCNGERLYATDNAASYWTYGTDGADREVDGGVKIRGWDETEWHDPEVEEDVV